MIKLIQVVLLSAVISPCYAESPLPGDSIYQLQGEWRDQNAETVHLADLAGKRQLVSLVYTACEHTCPAIVSSMKMVGKSLPEAMQGNVGFVLVTLTPDSDTPAVLRAFAEQQDLDRPNWALLQGDPQNIRELAMVLGVKYQLLEDGQVNHSNLISVLDEQGRLSFQAPGFPTEVKNISEHLIND